MIISCQYFFVTIVLLHIQSVFSLHGFSSNNSLRSNNSGPWYIQLSGNPYIIEDKDGVSHIMALYNAARNGIYYDIKVYEENCQDEANDIFNEVLSISPLQLESEDVQLEADLTINLALIQDSSLYDYNAGKVRFCVETALYSDETLTTKVVRHRTIYTATLDLTQPAEVIFTLKNVEMLEDYEEEHNVVSDENETGDERNVVDIYQCYFDSLEEIINPPALNAGDQLTLCADIIVGDDNHDPSRMFIEGIQWMQLERTIDEDNGVRFRFDVITDGREDEMNNDLVDYWCEGTKCVATMVLIDAFFEDDELTTTNNTLDVKGEAIIGSTKEEKGKSDVWIDDFSMSVDLKSCDSQKIGLLSMISIKIISF